MSTQGTLTVGRTAHVPVWPFVVAVLGVAAVVIGLTVGLTLSKDRVPEQAGSAVSTAAIERSSAAVHEGGVYAPGAGVAPTLDPTAFASEQAEQVLARYAAMGRLGWLDPTDFASAGADGVRARYAAMGRLGRVTATGAIVIDGWVCHQCR